MPEGLSISKIMDFLVANATEQLPPHALAEVFDRLIWCLADNGKEVLMVRNRWLQGDDRQKVEIALAMNETFPMDGGQLMEDLLEGISRRWPSLRERCAEISSEWKKTYSAK